MSAGTLAGEPLAGEPLAADPLADPLAARAPAPGRGAGGVPGLASRSGRPRPLDALALLKPRIALASGAAAWVGYRVAGGEGLAAGAAVAGAAALTAGAACCFNMVIERDLDARMRRTAGRPLPAGRVSAVAATAFGAAAAVAGLGVLYGASNALATALAAVSLALYTLVYTPLKRVTPGNTLVGAVAGALPPVIGWASAGGGLAPGAWALFAMLFFWQLPHFLAIAWIYREDYARAGMPMLPVVDEGGRVVGRQAVLYAAYLLVASLGPVWLGLAGPIYLVAALVLGLAYLFASALLLLAPSLRAARRVFAISLVHLAGTYAALWLDASGAPCSNVAALASSSRSMVVLDRGVDAGAALLAAPASRAALAPYERAQAALGPATARAGGARRSG